MRLRKYTIIALFISTLFWFSDSFIHYFIYNETEFEIIPSDLNELWMRTSIILLLIVFGSYIDYSISKLLKKERQLEAARIYKSMVFATHHILNNLLNQMQLVKIEASECKDFNPKTLELYDSTINEAKSLINKLSDIRSITDQDIVASIQPSKISDRVDTSNKHGQENNSTN